jgi:hypothetical protein
MALTAKQQAFVTAYLDGGMSNGSAAYRVAYPNSRKWSAQVVANKANELLNHGDIRVIIASARAKSAQAMAATEDRYAVTKERISRGLAQMAFADARKLFTWTSSGVALKSSDELTDDEAAAVVSVSHTVTEAGGTIKVQLGDKRQALMDLAKLHGHIIDRKDVRLIKSIDDLREDELAALAATELPEDADRATKH